MSYEKERKKKEELYHTNECLFMKVKGSINKKGVREGGSVYLSVL